MFARTNAERSTEQHPHVREKFAFPHPTTPHHTKVSVVKHSCGVSGPTQNQTNGEYADLGFGDHR